MDYHIDHLEKHGDKRGDLIVFLKESELESKNKKFGQIYFVTFEKKGVMRGNHYHKKWREWFGIVAGKLKVSLRDVKTGKETELLIDADADSYTRLEIGPHIHHTFVSLSDYAALLNYTNDEWDENDTFRTDVNRVISKKKK